MKSSTFRINRWILSGAVVVMAILAASTGLAVQPGRWSHSAEADFDPGKRENTIVTNLGDIKLAASTTTLNEIPEQATVIYDMQPIGDDLYLAVGPEGKLLRRRGEKVDVVAVFEGEQIFSLDKTADGKLLLAISGEKTRLATLDGDKPVTITELPGIRYVWDIVVDNKTLYLATGTEGRLLRIDLAKLGPAPAKKEAPAAAPDKKADAKKSDKSDEADDDADDDKDDEEEPKPEALSIPGITELLHSAQANILCLARDGKGRLYAGTDTDGLIYRIILKPDGTLEETFVLYDAPEPEIGALVVTADGIVYAGTADAEQARPGRLVEAEASSTGRPEVPAIDDQVPAPAQPGEPGEAPVEPGDIPQVTPKPDPVTPSSDAGDVEGMNEAVASPKGEVEEQGAQPRLKLPPGIDLRTADLDTLADQLATEQLATESADGSTPSKEARDQLRQVIRERLEQARKTGSLQAAPRRVRRIQSANANAGGRPPSAGMQSSGPTKEGNAVYRITPDGFVREVFRESSMILKLLISGDRLLVATGNEGELYSVNMAAGETVILADLEAQQIPAMTTDAKGAILLGTANPATIVRMDAGFAKFGKFTSAVLDSEQVSLWGRANLTTAIPAGTSITVQTRSGNVLDPDQAAWSPWSEPVKLDPAASDEQAVPRELTITSPPARFIQYQLTFSGNGESSGVVHSIDLFHIVPNLKPTVASVRATYPDGSGAGSPGGSSPANAGPRPPRNAPGAGNDTEPEPAANLNVEWEASDPNNDTLSYTLEYQPAGSKVWLPIEKDVTQNSFEWQTRRVPDGRYIIRVTASDATDNPGDMALTTSRKTDPVLIDNTPPAFADLKSVINKKALTLTGRITDALSPIQSLHYGLDAEKGWKPILPDGLIFDSTSESFTVTIPDLSVGHHAVTLRGLDARGNPVYQTVLIDVK